MSTSLDSKPISKMSSSCETGPMFPKRLSPYIGISTLLHKNKTPFFLYSNRETKNNRIQNMLEYLTHLHIGLLKFIGSFYGQQIVFENRNKSKMNVRTNA